MAADDFRSIHEPVASRSLDILEEALKRALERGDVDEALKIYAIQFGGYRHLGWRLGDYERGLRLTSMLVDAGGMDLHGAYSTRPWLEQSLFYLDRGRPKVAEERLRELLPVYKRELARKEELMRRLRQEEALSVAELEEASRLYNHYRGSDWEMYEANLLQSVCDALTAQGRLVEAEEMATAVIGEAGANPWARRAVARFLLGKSEAALEDFGKAADFAAKSAYRQERSRWRACTWPGTCCCCCAWVNWNVLPGCCGNAA